MTEQREPLVAQDGRKVPEKPRGACPDHVDDPHAPEYGSAQMRAYRRPTRRRWPPSESAFLNIPYDVKYENLLLAFFAGLSGFALIPRATLDIPGSQRRLDRIVHLLRRCRYSFHDLSRVELDPAPPATPRFNMPFELGLAVALATVHRSHQWFVFEARPRRAWKGLSDLAGTDEYLHEGTPRGVLHALTNALVRRRHQPALAALEEIYRDVREFAVDFKRRVGTRSLFEARAFRELGLAARRSARRRIPSWRSEERRRR